MNLSQYHCKQIGERLRALRGDTPAEETAKAVGISIKALSAYENGERIPRDEIKIKLAYHYGKSVESIFYAQLASAAGVM